MNPAMMPFGAFSARSSSSFNGRHDKFAPNVTPGGMSRDDLAKALQIVAPEDVGGAVLSDSYVNDAINRLSAYSQYWKFYAGRHFDVPCDDGVVKTTTNFCKVVADKRAAWAVGKGFTIRPHKGNELVADVFNKVWCANGKNSLLRQVAKTSHVTGDAFIYVTVRTKDRSGKPLPLNKQSVRFSALNPSYVFPVWKENEPSELAACYLHFPIWDSEGTRYKAFTAFITPEKVNYYTDGVLIKSRLNPLGVVNVLHVPTEPSNGNVFGTSVLQPVIPLNEAYNATRHAISKIIRYHGEPTTLVFGMKFSNMERGANRLWSNLPNPKEADVRNLEMRGDLSQFKLDLEESEKHIYRMGKTPKVCFDSEGLAISNTSGIAMALLFQPLVEASIEAQELMASAISRGNQLIAIIHAKLFGEDLSELADDAETMLDNQIVFESLLPKDRQMEMDVLTKQLDMGIISRAEASRRLSDVTDTQRLAVELAADRNADLALKAEESRAALGMPLNFRGPLLDSMFLHEDLLSLATQIPEATQPKGIS